MKRFFYSFLTEQLVAVTLVLVPLHGFSQLGPEQLISKPVFTHPEIIHAADLNGDGKEDVIAANQGTMVWWENTGVNEFTNLDTISSDTILIVSSIFATDIDGDLDNDILCTYSRSYICFGFAADSLEQLFLYPPPLPAPSHDGYVALFENLGGGVFGPIQILDDSIPKTESVHVADFDLDLDLDIVVGASQDYPCNDSTGLAIWYENLGGNTFGPRQLIAPLSDQLSVYEIRAMKVNNDQYPDVVATYNADGAVVWFENLNGTGFGPQQVLDTTVSMNCKLLELADLDGDNTLDLLLGNYDEVFWIEHTDSVFGNEIHLISDQVLDLRGIHAADIDDDQDLDVVSASAWNHKIAWYENDGNGTFGPQNVVDTLAWVALQAITVDANQDEQLEILALSDTDDEIAWYPNLENGQFDEQRIITPDVFAPHHLVCIDMDGDTDPDVVVASTYNDKILLYENLGNGNFSNSLVLASSLDDTYALDFGDVDNDGDPDIIATGAFRIFWFENLGGLNFSSAQVVTNTTFSVRAIRVGLLNSDAYADVVSLQQASDKVVWYPNLGNGTFGTEIVLSNLTDLPTGVDIADLDGDNDNDIVVGCFNGGKVVWFENLGAGVFAPEQILSTVMYNGQAVHAADIDQDNDVDVIVGASSSIHWIENIGPGNFLPPVQLTSAIYPYSIKGDDIDNDGYRDMLTGTNTSVLLYHNDGSAVFDSLEVVWESPGSLDGNPRIYVTTSDIDGDTDLDIVMSSSGDYRVSWFENLNLITDISENVAPRIDIYPNPTTGVCIAKLNEPADLTVYDAVGRAVLSKRCNILAQIHLEKQPAGVYLFRFETNHGPVVQQVVKLE